MISASKLNKYFYRHKSNEIHVIDNFDFVLPDKGITAIFGKSGCGKTTLLNVLGGLDKADSGVVNIDGNVMKNGNDFVRNKYIGYIFQNYNLNKDKTVFENVADILRLCGVTDNEVISQRVEYALKSVGMANYAKRTPENLSGGQQQRVAIARAIVKSPRIILADEPTGNLDEANTIMVMDMLKAASSNCLVLLVTHEEKLVDHYCDNVIELSDGRVINHRINFDANGYNARSKNDIYLGEFDKSDSNTDECNIEYYGDKIDSKINVKIVNNNGTLYLRVDTPGIKVIDESSEIKLREGVFVEKKTESGERLSYTSLSPLPDMKKSKYGKLFTFFDSFKKGLMSIGTDRRKGKKFLRTLMGMFSAVIVIFSAVYGSKLKNLSDTKSSFNKSIILANYELKDIVDTLEKAVADKNSGIDFYSYSNDYFGNIASGGDSLYFKPDYFITSTASSTDELIETVSGSLSSIAMKFPFSVVKDVNVIAGEKKDGAEYIWITKQIADELLESSTDKYINNYESLIGIKITASNVNYELSAIINSNERSYYVQDDVFYNYHLNYNSLNIKKGEDVKKGSVVYKTTKYAVSPGVMETSSQGNAVNAEEKIMICGKEYVVSDVVNVYSQYAYWLYDTYPDEYYRVKNILISNSINVDSVYEYLLSDRELAEKYGVADCVDAGEVFEYHPFAAYRYAFSRYSEWVDICKESGAFTQDYVNFVESGEIKDAEYVVFFKECNMMDSNTFERDAMAIYYSYVKYVEENDGTEPDLEYFLNAYESNNSDPKNLYYAVYNEVNSKLSSSVNTPSYIVTKEYYSSYDTDYYYKDYYDLSNSDAYFLMNPSDFDIAKRTYGETSACVDWGTWESKTQKEYEGYISEYFDYYSSPKFYIIHCTNTELAENYLEAIYGEIDKNIIEDSMLITTEQIEEYALTANDISVLGIIIPFVIVVALLAICVYFILRSTLMNRVKEIGIYRSIGVTKNNIRFEFMSETLSLVLTSVLPAFVLVSGAMFYMISKSNYIAKYLFYPPWFAVVMLAFTTSVCIFCGLIPINRLIRKTPAELIAKYDI